MPEIAWWTRPEIVAPICTFMGALIGLIGSAITLFINRRFDDRRHLREMAIKTAFSHWERHLEMLRAQANFAGRTLHANPLEGFIVHMLLLADLISKKSLTEENVVRELARIRRVSDAIFDTAPGAHRGKG